jgi:hypothetical protein
LSSSDPKLRSDCKGSRVGKGATDGEFDVFEDTGFGEWASRIQPVKKLTILVIVIQKCKPNLRNFM